MRKTICFLTVVMLLLTGCQAVSQPAETTTAPLETTVPAVQETTAPTLPEATFSPGLVIGGMEGDQLPFENAGKVRLPYEGNRAYVRYVTSVEDLPPECSWEGYDAAYFETKALLIVVETVNSGSVQLELEAITLDGDTASVHIKRTMSGDVGTTDMATWMLWAELSREYDYNWVLPNSTNLPEGEKY